MCQFEWITLTYEGTEYDICVGIAAEELEEVRPTDSEININPVMDLAVIEWMLSTALDKLRLDNEPPFLDMSAREIEVEEAGVNIEKTEGA